jgi:large subunit ribosomal protein L22
MEIKAKLKYFRGSPIKIRNVARLIKGKAVEEAQAQLKSRSGKGPQVILKLLNSAAANAQNNFNLPKVNLFIKEVLVDQGPVFKRYLPRARGRADTLRKPTAHITLILDEANSKSKAPMTKQAQNPKHQTLSSKVKV